MNIIVAKPKTYLSANFIDLLFSFKNNDFLKQWQHLYIFHSSLWTP